MVRCFWLCDVSKNVFPVFRIKENELVREQEKTENKRDGEKQEKLKELYQREQRKETERQAKQKRDLMQSHLVGSQQGSLSGTLKTFSVLNFKQFILKFLKHALKCKLYSS